MLNLKKNKENNKDSYEKEMEEIKSSLVWRKAENYFQEIQEMKNKEKDKGERKGI